MRECDRTAEQLAELVENLGPVEFPGWGEKFSFKEDDTLGGEDDEK